jgi:hypothetical protein
LQKKLIHQKSLEELIDRRVYNEARTDPISLGIANELIKIGKLCTKDSAKERPEVVEVLKALDLMNVPSRSASVASYSQISNPTPMDIQRAYDSYNRQRTISGDSSWVLKIVKMFSTSLHRDIF